MSHGILSYGAYVPPIRLKREAIAAAVGWAVPAIRGLASGERSVANWDEDAVTMAVEAARDCVFGIAAPIPSVSLASTTLPFADRSNSGIVADALNLDNSVSNEDLTGSRRAATSALARAAAGQQSGLLVASDCRETRPGSTQEMLYGHAAAALLLGEGKPIAHVLGSAAIHEDLIDQYRASDSDFDYALEERWVREEGWLKIVPSAMEQAARAAGVKLDEIDHFAVHASTAVARALAKHLGLDGKRFVDPLQGGLGDCGVAQPLLLLNQTLANAGNNDLIMVVGFGQGADAIVIKTTDQLAAVKPGRGVQRQLDNGRASDNYAYYLSLRQHISIDFGLRAERDNRTALSAYYRKRRDITSMLGGRCSDCGTLQFPRSVLCVKCTASDTQVPESLAGLHGQVKSFTEDWLAYSPSPPYIYGHVEFEDGANVMLEFADFAAGEVAVGATVRLVFRVKDFDEKRNFRRYFWKPAPLMS